MMRSSPAFGQIAAFAASKTIPAGKAVRTIADAKAEYVQG